MRPLVLVVFCFSVLVASGQNRYEEVVMLRDGVVGVTVGGVGMRMGVDPTRERTVVRQGVVFERVGVGENLFVSELAVEVGAVPDGLEGVLGRDFFAGSVITIDRREGSLTISAPYKPAWMPLRNRREMPAADEVDSLLEKGVVTFDFVRGKAYFAPYGTVDKPAFQAPQPAEKGTVEALGTVDFLREVYDFRAGGEWKYRGKQPCVVDFWAPWCRPCLALNPIVEALAGEYADRVKFYKVNIDDEREVAKYFNVRMIPMMLFIPVDGPPRPVMVASPDDIRKNMEALLKP